MTTKDLTVQDLHTFLDMGSWRFANTMPENPHEYIVKPSNPEKKAEFEKMVMLMRENAIYEEWNGMYFQYYYYDGYKYWTMDYPIHITKIINRAKND